MTTTENDWTIHLPSGMRLIRGPLASEVRSAFGVVRVDVEQSMAVVHVKTTVTLDRSRIAASDYSALRAWCEAADRILGQRVVVSK
jgi:Domain of Unknown Function with PDB structure (DUF3858)